jgi:hypothetical protein
MESKMTTEIEEGFKNYMPWQRFREAYNDCNADWGLGTHIFLLGGMVWVVPVRREAPIFERAIAITETNGFHINLIESAKRTLSAVKLIHTTP